MQYALLIYADEAGWEEAQDSERAAMLAQYVELARDLRARGQLLGGEELCPVATATSVRVREGDTIVSDGPFTETKEALGGFYLIEAESLDEAIEWASRIPAAKRGTIEIRPLVPGPGERS
jgi:hypothetical protein